MTNKNVEELTKLMRQLVSDVQGAPYTSEKIEPELYSIWYERVQRGAQNCFEFLEQHFPLDNSEFKDSLKKIFK